MNTFNWVLPSNFTHGEKNSTYSLVRVKTCIHTFFSLFPLAGGPGMVHLWEHSTGWSWRICRVAQAGRWFSRLLNIIGPNSKFRLMFLFSTSDESGCWYYLHVFKSSKGQGTPFAQFFLYNILLIKTLFFLQSPRNVVVSCGIKSTHWQCLLVKRPVHIECLQNFVLNYCKHFFNKLFSELAILVAQSTLNKEKWLLIRQIMLFVSLFSLLSVLVHILRV